MYGYYGYLCREKRLKFDDSILGPEGTAIPRSGNESFGQHDEEAYRAKIARRVLLAGLMLATILFSPTIIITFRNGD
jgi:hypothetical protein